MIERYSCWANEYDKQLWFAKHDFTCKFLLMAPVDDSEVSEIQFSSLSEMIK